MADRELVTVAEAAKLIKLAPATLYKLASQGRVRSFKVLGALRFDPTDLGALVVERGTRTAEPTGPVLGISRRHGSNRRR